MLHLVFGIDDRYLPPMLVSLYTALKNTTKPVRITVMTVGPIEKSEIEKVVKHFGNATLEIREFNTDVLQDYGKTPATKKFPVASMIPVFIPWLVNSRCLFLDADTLIIKDVYELFSTDLNGLLIGATRAYHNLQFTFQNATLSSLVRWHKFSRLRKEHDDHKIQIGFTNKEYDNLYFSSGIVLFDVPAIKSLDTSMSRLLKVCQNKNLQAHLPDQDIMNVYYKNQVMYLDVKWNVYKDILGKRSYLSSEFNTTINKATSDPAILHYVQIYDRRCWEMNRRKAQRFRYQVYRQTCLEVEKEIGVNLIRMFQARV